VRLDDESVLEDIRITEPGDLTTVSLTGTQQALLLGLWSVQHRSYLCCHQLKFFYTVVHVMTHDGVLLVAADQMLLMLSAVY